MLKIFFIFISGVVLFQNCSKMSFETIDLSSQGLNVPCTELTPDSFAPKLKWDWVSNLDLTKPENYPNYLQVMASPVVGDLNGDGIPEVVFVSWSTSQTGTYNGKGILRIVDGATGATLKSVGDDNIAPFASTTPLLIDIDGDGKSEIFYSHYSGKSIIALNYDGSLRWKYDVTDLASGETLNNKRSFAAADLDGDGKAEIITGGRAYSEDASGNPIQKWTAATSSSAGYTYAISLDPSHPNDLQVVGNSAIYDKSGKVLFSLPAGDYAAADIDNKAGLELVGTGGGHLKIVNTQNGNVKDIDLSIYNELQCSKGIGGGGATIGDFDGDSTTTEIAVATGRYLTIFDSNGTLISKYPTQDCSSLSTGISSFDFNGDGKPEILYGDEEYFRVFEMINGQLQVVWSTVNPSGTLNEYPVVADIDGNQSSELLVVSNNYAANSFYKDAGEENDLAIAQQITGVRAFESGSANAWMPTRSVWNSWNYNPALVTDQLRAVTSTSLDAFTSKLFRRNAQLKMFENKCVVQ